MFFISEMSDELIERKIELCNELLNVADTLEPGLSRFRGSLLFDLQAAMAVQAKRNYVNGQITKKTAQVIQICIFLRINIIATNFARISLHKP